MSLDIGIDTVGPWSVVNLRGRIDAVSANEFDRALRELIGSGGQRVLFNCAELRYVSSVGIGIFVECAKLASASGGYLSFAAMNPHVSSLFQMVGFVGLFQVYPSVEEALKEALDR
ncbi:MAG: anti-sigma-factor antagonist [Candidatus Solibacter sp.]|jgi:anti-anti-sigma factor|nr:anti-sigma-factor antagonist [Candidatus Solibacter sp.]